MKLGTILLIWLTIMVLVPQIAYAADPVCHIVESGDTVWGIGMMWNVAWPSLAAYNNLTNPDLIHPGDTICWENHNAVEYALAQVGKPYIYGGVGPYGFDCSGLVVAAYCQVGVWLPHNASLQWQLSTGVERPQSGDLVFYGDGNIVHVGLMIDSQNMIHATSRYGQVVIESPWIYNNLRGFGRIN